MQDALHLAGISRHRATLLGTALGALLVVIAIAFVVPSLAAVVTKTKRVSLSSSGAQGNQGSFSPAISADGRFVAFDSAATNLVGNDTNGSEDVFVRDLKAHKTRRVSLSSAGVQGDGLSFSPSISADGRFVAFASHATNLVGGDTNGFEDVFVRDLKTHKTRRVSLSSTGAQADGDSFEPSISPDAGSVGFVSYATNLVGNDTNGYADIFVRGVQTHKTRR